MSQLSVLVPAGGRHPGAGSHRRRRPSGEPPPLPYDLGRSGRHWAWLSAVVLVTWIGVMFGLGDAVDRLDNSVLRWIVSGRSEPATAAARHLEALGSPAVVLALSWTVIAVALAFRRFRHLVAFLGCVLASTWITANIAAVFARPRPVGIEILGHWRGYSHPSKPLTDVAVAPGGADLRGRPPGTVAGLG